MSGRRFEPKLPTRTTVALTFTGICNVHKEVVAYAFDRASDRGYRVQISYARYEASHIYLVRRFFEKLHASAKSVDSAYEKRNQPFVRETFVNVSRTVNLPPPPTNGVVDVKAARTKRVFALAGDQAQPAFF